MGMAAKTSIEPMPLDELAWCCYLLAMVKMLLNLNRAVGEVAYPRAMLLAGFIEMTDLPEITLFLVKDPLTQHLAVYILPLGFYFPIFKVVR